MKLSSLFSQYKKLIEKNNDVTLKSEEDILKSFKFV